MCEEFAVTEFRRGTNNAASERPKQHRGEEHQNGRNREFGRIREADAASLRDHCRDGEH